MVRSFHQSLESELEEAGYWCMGRQSKAGTRGKALGGKARQGTVWARQGTSGKALGGQGKARQAMHLVA